MKHFRKILIIVLAIALLLPVMQSNVFAREAEEETGSHWQFINPVGMSGASANACVSFGVQPTGATSGYCGGEGDGTNLKWSFSSSTGTLKITGTGAMYPYWTDERVPTWLEHFEDIKTVEIGSGVTTIGQAAFYRLYRMTKVTIPNTVKSIGIGAFLNCEGMVDTITIPSSVTAIGDGAFAGTRIRSIVIPDSVKSLGTYVFEDCGHLQTAKLGTGVRSIPEGTFYLCWSLRSFTIPENVRVIGTLAFEETDSLESIAIPGTVTTIQDRAFIMSGLVKLTISDGVKSIGQEAFEECTRLQKVVIPGSVQTIGKWAFNYCHSLTSLTLKNGVQTIGNGAFMDTAIETLTIPDSVTQIGTQAFSCTEITSVKMGTGLTELPLLAFESCSNLTDVQFGKNITKICDEAFSGCSKLTTITLPSNVKSLGYGVFLWCRALKDVKLNDSLEVIGADAFRECAIEEITIPVSVKTIESYAFNLCENLKTVKYSGTVAQWEALLSGTVNPELSNATVEHIVMKPKIVSVENRPEGVLVKWDSIVGTDGYEILRSAYSGGSWGAKVKVGTIEKAAADSFTDTTAKPGTTYRYYVRAYQVMIDKTLKYSAYTTNYLPIRRLEVPVIVSLTNTKPGMELKWTTVKGAYGYEILRCTYTNGKYGAWKTIATIEDGSADTYLDKTPVSGNGYKYAVRAFHKTSTDTYYSAWENNTKATRRLRQPALTSAANTGSGLTSGVQVKWAEVPGATGYYVYRKTADTAWKKIATVDGLSYLDTTCEANTNYSYSVRAYMTTSTGSTFQSSYDQTGLEVRRMLRPTIETAENSAPGKLTVTWKNKSGTTGMQVAWSTSKDFSTGTSTYRTAKTSRTVDVTSGTTYYVRIRTYYTDETGKIWYSGWSSVKTITIEN